MSEWGDIVELGYTGTIAIGESYTLNQTPANTSILMGSHTDEHGTNNIIMGSNSKAIGNGNIIIGINTVVKGNNNYVVGHNLDLTGNYMYYVHQQVLYKIDKYLRKKLPEELVKIIINIISYTFADLKR